jgi:hypothetical protein
VNSVHPFLSQGLIYLSLLSSLLLLAKAAVAEVKVVESGNVKAEFSFQEQNFCLTSPHLKLMSAGQVVLDQLLPESNNRPCRLTGLQIVNLDNAQQPEVIIDLYTGGAHCCTYSLIYYFEPQSKQYKYLEHSWGNVGYRLKALDRKGRLQFVSADDRFAYEFSSYAASAFPIQIWQYQLGKMVDVTRQYPQLIYSNAYYQWHLYSQQQKQCQPFWGACGEGILAAYLADKYLLGQEQDGWQRVRASYRGGGCEASGVCRGAQNYFNQLRQFLQKTSYIQR